MLAFGLGNRDVDSELAIGETRLGLVRVRPLWERNATIELAVTALAPIKSTPLICLFLLTFAADNQILIGYLEFDVFGFKAGNISAYAELAFLPGNVNSGPPRCCPSRLGTAGRRDGRHHAIHFVRYAPEKHSRATC